ncbi:RiPP maturation radical SAM C-methyltransferase [Streptomyces sp. NPDC047081]|uniref:RiPP maturation radical SAM C-methyltransferase n=1 Tax=Streptomyces sp. NPDC047081 TaxID=3154706 RepID=UPI0033C17129
MPSAPATRRDLPPVLLVCMPFMDDRRPSLQIGLLKAIARTHGFPAHTLHANLDFAAALGVDRYRLLAGESGCQLGDWLFSPEAFGSAAPDSQERFLDLYVDGIARAHEMCPDTLRAGLLRIRQHDVPAYLDALVEAYPWDRFRLVGFTSTFQQNTASIALARRLKERYPDLFIVFGGANFDSVMGMELVRGVPCVDAAIIGEADTAFPILLEALAGDGDLDAVPGLARKVSGHVVTAPPSPLVTRLDDLPAPDYDEYFEHAEHLGLLPATARRSVYLPIETARGCWWGTRHHCTFCGLNGKTMEFRSKSAERVLDEFAHQTRRYRSFRFEAVDNILDMRYLRTLFPALVESGAQYELFYEVKANLSRRQLELLADAGVVQMQPGIESFSSHVLRLMRKGVTAAQNVNLLRWAQHYGIRVSWNLLWGFPGETREDCADQAAALWQLEHLQPPGSAARITMERFSPLFTDREGILRDLRPDPSYAHIYPADLDLARIAYFFSCDIDGALPDSAYVSLRRAAADWQDAWRDEAGPPVLEYRQAPHYVQIHDNRRKGSEGTYLFEGFAADLYLACCERPVTADALRRRLAPRGSVEAVERALKEFAEAGLVFRDGPLTVALAVPAARTRLIGG